MFLHQRGQKVWLLHSYRDGAGTVRHRRLGEIRGREGLESILQGWPGWLQSMRQRFPWLRLQEERLRARAEQVRDSWRTPRRRLARAAMGSPGAAPDRADSGEQAPKLRPEHDGKARVLQAVRKLHELLEQFPELRQTVLEELQEPGEGRLSDVETALAEDDLETAELHSQDCLRQTRLAFPSHRVRLAPGDPYLRALDLRVDIARRQGQWEEGCACLQERVRRCPSPEARLELGAFLHRLGRTEEALEEYRRLPKRHAWRYFHSAAGHHRDGRYREAMADLLKGLNRDRGVGDGLKIVLRGGLPWLNREYWERYGDLWTEAARRFFWCVYKQKRVRAKLYFAKGRIVRELVDERTWPILEREVLADYGADSPSAVTGRDARGA